MREEGDGGRGGDGRGTAGEPVLDKKTLIAGYTMASIVVSIVILCVVVVVMCEVYGGKQDCSGDGFMEARFNSSFTRESEYLKYKVLSRNAMDAAKEGCVGENATLWEVLQGGNEWDSIYQSLSEDTRRAIWINAKALETCSEHLGQDDVEYCKTDDAKHGVGLALAWPSIGEYDAMVTGEIGSYSRFIGGVEKEGDGCMSTNGDGLWVNVDCGQSTTRHAVCVKRNCIEPSEK